MKYKFLANIVSLWIGTATALACVGASGQEPVKIGRSQLSLPNPSQWEVIEIELPANTYTGDVSGKIPLQTKRLRFKSIDSLTKAVIVTSMTKNAISAQMSWENTCKGLEHHEFLYVRDRGSETRLDCLLIIKTPRLLSLQERIDQNKSLFNEVIPHTLTGYYVQYELGLSNGSQTSSFVFLAEGFNGLAANRLENPTKIPDAVVAWALAFAKENNAALTSLFGNWTLPSFNFNQPQ